LGGDVSHIVRGLGRVGIRRPVLRVVRRVRGGVRMAVGRMIIAMLAVVNLQEVVGVGVHDGRERLRLVGGEGQELRKES
jgi:hypothetical protein